MLVLCFNCLESGHTGFHSDCPLYTPTSNFKGSDSSTPHPPSPLFSIHVSAVVMTGP